MSNQQDLAHQEYIGALVERSRKAFAWYEFASQEKVDFICARIAWACSRPEFAREIADFTFSETGLGDAQAKFAKMNSKVKAIYAQMKDERTCGIIEKDVEPGIIKYAKPIGVVGVLIPVTNPEMTPVIKALWALKTRNSIILAPHPRALNVNNRAVGEMRRVLEKYGYPADLVIPVEDASVQNSKELMRQCDFNLATGGPDMVKSAYSSGKPALGVGSGNAYMIVDETVDTDDTALKIRMSKTFDNASGCSADNGCLIFSGIYDKMIGSLENEGGYLVKKGSDEKKRLQAALWDEQGRLSRDIVARPALTIAALAGLDVPENTRFLMVEEEGIGPDFPFSKDKLSPVLTVYQWDDFDRAVDMVNEITGHCGAGHSCGIHSFNEERIAKLAQSARVSRVTVRQPHGLANSGSWTNGLANTCTLGCGTWGGNSVSENVTFKHLLNTTRLSYETESRQVSDEDLFGPEVMSSI